MDCGLSNGIEPILLLTVLLNELWVKKMCLVLRKCELRNLEVKGHDVSDIFSKAQKKSCVYMCIHMGKKEMRQKEVRGRRRGWTDKAN